MKARGKLAVIVGVAVAAVAIGLAPRPLPIEAQPQVARGSDTSALPLRFALQGNQTEITGNADGTAVHPVTAPAGLTGALVVSGTGAIHFLPGSGVWFSDNGQQRQNAAFLQFKGEVLGTLFDNTGPGEVSLKLRSKYSFAERKALPALTKNRLVMRTAVDVYSDTSHQLRLEVNLDADHLAILYKLGAGAVGYYRVPAGQEDELFGRGKVLAVRLTWNGISTGQLFLNHRSATTFSYRKSHVRWKDGSFAIGARDQHEYGGGFWASDDGIAEVEVRNGGPLRDTSPPSLEVPGISPQTTLTGTHWFRAIADDSEAVSGLTLLIDGKESAVCREYPFSVFLDTRTLPDGPHQLDFIAKDSSGNQTKRTFAVTVRNGERNRADREPPQSVTGLGTSLITSQAVTIHWDAATDDSGAVRYAVLRNGISIAEVAVPQSGEAPTASYGDSGLRPGTNYRYQVAAIDGAGNRGRLPAPLEVTTQAMDGKILSVGPTGKYARPCEAFRAAAPWDTVEIDASGNYDGDVCVIANNHLTIRGVNGRPHIDANGSAAQRMGIWVINGADNLVENVELSGATVVDRNGAAIRFRGRNLTLRHVYFHHNEDGILATAPSSGYILIENSEFGYNGAEDGYSHNMYIGPIDRFELRYSYSHHALSGHLVKSRARENYILYNRLTDEGGRVSYETDLPNGGHSLVIGNLFEQSPTPDNSILFSYGMEGIDVSRSSQLYIVNNTFVNHALTGAFLHFAPKTGPALIANNLFIGRGSMAPEGGSVRRTTNIVAATLAFLDPAHWDFHPSRSSPAAGTGSTLAAEDRDVMTPRYEYVHPTAARERPPASLRDAGAFAAQE